MCARYICPPTLCSNAPSGTISATRAPTPMIFTQGETDFSDGEKQLISPRMTPRNPASPFPRF